MSRLRHPLTLFVYVNYPVYYLIAYMMKLVDMRGLKPRPFRGPGSTPGIGTHSLHTFSSLLLKF